MEQSEISAEAVESERGRRGGLPWFMWVFVAILVYALSVGPAERLSRVGAFPRWMLVIYSPLGFACEQCAPARRALDWYVHDLWGVPRFWAVY